METPVSANVIHIDITKTLHAANGPMEFAVKTGICMGEVTALFGPSGAGKSTLLRILAGLAEPDSGTILFGETAWFDRARKINLPPQQRNTGFMFQDYALFPNMTVRENIQFAHGGKDTTATDLLLTSFTLNELAGQKPGKLSGGQQQRVALARTLVRKPQLLLLDEPLSALDTELRTSLQQKILKAHRATRATTIMVTHDVEEATRLADFVLCLEAGKITASGTPKQIFK